MRPPESLPENIDQIVILDTRPELDVIRDGLDDRKFMSSLVVRHSAGDLPSRFRQYTMHQPPGTDRLDDLMAWNQGAEFAITFQDVQFAYAAARRICDQRGPINWIANNWLSKRAVAARFMVEVLQSAVVEGQSGS